MSEADRRATRSMMVRNVLARHSGKLLTPDVIEYLVREFDSEMRLGPCAWAFE